MKTNKTPAVSKSKICFTIMTVMALSTTSIKAQWSPTWPGNIPNWNAAGSGNSEPALQRPTPWALGGNSVFGMPGSWQGQINNAVNNTYKTASIGTVDDAPFILKANNRESIYLSQGGRVSLGYNNVNTGAPIDMWSAINSATNRSRLSFYVDLPGNIESSESMSLLFRSQAGLAFDVKEGTVSGGSVSRFTALSGGNCGINNSAPTVALDIKAASNPSNFRIYGDAAGNVHSTVDMKLHYGILGSSEFQINNGTPGSATTRMLLNSFGAHFNTNGAFNGLFIGPSSSPWYNFSTSNRLWLDAVASNGIGIVCGNGSNAIAVANPAGAGRFEMKINAGGGNDTKFKLGGSAQFGFYNSVAVFEDVNTRVNVDAFGVHGVKVTTNSNTNKAFFVDNSNFSGTTPNTFIVYGDGRTQIGPNFPDPTGVAASAALSVNGMILTKEIRVALATGTHWNYPDFVFGKDYKLMPLAEVEKFISKEHHLPEIPSEKVAMKEGMELTEMNLKLLQKVEELYLHVIQINKNVEDLKKENGDLKEQLGRINQSGK